MGSTRYGWCFDSHGAIVAHPQEQLIIRTAQAWRDRGRSYAEIATGLARLGLYSRRKEPFTTRGVLTLLRRSREYEPPSSAESFAGIVDADGELVSQESDASH